MLDPSTEWDRVVNTNTWFIGVAGRQMREGEAASYLNVQEAAVVVDCVMRMVYEQKGSPERRVTVEDVGVLATYRR